DALARFHLRDGDCDSAIGRDLDERAERLFALHKWKIALEVARPQGEADDQPNPGAAADQQCPAIELQLAYWALSARRSILPVPSRGKGSGEMMMRSGILKRASFPSRNVRSSCGSSCSPPFRWMIATGTSPRRSSGAPNTAASATEGQA